MIINTFILGGLHAIKKRLIVAYLRCIFYDFVLFELCVEYSCKYMMMNQDKSSPPGKTMISIRFKVFNLKTLDIVFRIPK